MYIFYLIIILLLIFLDQITKYYIVSNFNLAETRIIIEGFFNITHVRNNGAGFSILQGHMTLFYIVTVIVLIFLIYMLIKTKNRFNSFIYLLLIGGALGNFIDRIRLKYVIDFLDFNIFGYDFPVFNLADTFLTIGVILMIINLVLEERNAHN